MHKFEWSFLSAYGASCSLIYQLSNAVIKAYEFIVFAEDDECLKQKKGNGNSDSVVGVGRGGNKKKKLRSKHG